MKKLLGILLIVVLTLNTLVSCDVVFFNSDESKSSYYIPVKAELTSSYGTATIILDFGENDLASKKTSLMNNETFEIFEFFYDSNNKLSKLVQERDGEVYSALEYSYGYGLNGLASNIMMSDGQTVNYIYDSKGRLTERVITFEGSTILKECYSYDKNGNVTEMLSYNDGGLRYTTTYSYDYRGRLIQKVTDEGLKYTYTYDYKGNLVKVVAPGYILPSNTYGDFTYELTYDANGNIAEIKVTNTGGEEYICTFEYKEGTPSQDIEINRHVSVAALFSSAASVLSFHSSD